jgi:hypothetical protein
VAAGGAELRRAGGRLDGAATGGAVGVVSPSGLASTALGEGGGAGVAGRSTETAYATGTGLLSDRTAMTVTAPAMTISTPGTMSERTLTL